MFSTRTKRHLSLSSLAVAGVGITLIVGLRTGLAQPQAKPPFTPAQAGTTTIIGKDRDKVPAALQPCFPPQVPEAILMSTATKDGANYYLFTAYDEQGSDLLISLNQKGHCSVLLYRYPGDAIPWSQVTSIEVARSLALGLLKGEIEGFGGMTEYKRILQGMGEGEPTYWFPEDIWALKQLGLQPPRNFRVVKPKNNGSPMPQP